VGLSLHRFYPPPNPAAAALRRFPPSLHCFLRSVRPQAAASPRRLSPGAVSAADPDPCGKPPSLAPAPFTQRSVS
jgi:hypothetical protein